jgi:hypothetical protein
MKRTSVTVTIGALLVAGTALAAPAHAADLTAHHAPSVRVPSATQVAKPSTDKQQITTVILHSKLLGAVKPSNVAVSRIRFASSNHSWAAALVTPKNGQTDPAQVLLHKSANKWAARDLGTAGVGCGITSSAIRTQLGLHGPC